MYKYRKSKEWLKAQRKRTNVDLSSRRKLEIRRNDEFEQTISRWTVPRTLFRWIYRSFQVFIWFQDEYRNISFIPSYRKLLHVSIRQVNERFHTTDSLFAPRELFNVFVEKKNKERKRRRKTSVKGVWKIPSNFWIIKLRECGCTRTPASILLSAFYSLWDLWIRNF